MGSPTATPGRAAREGNAMVARPDSAEAPARRRNPDLTREEILDVAVREFARHGLAGARVDEIAAQTRTTKRMIYYYFGGKEQLYIAALERVYSLFRDVEARLDVNDLDPVAAIRQLAQLTLDHHEAHPDFIRLVAIENIHRAENISRSEILRPMNSPVITTTGRILERGYAAGVFRRRVDPVDLHMMISAFCFFRVANQHTFLAAFGRDLVDPASHELHREMVGDMVVSYLTG
jgi:AcrR family transcriptional regulator